MKDYSSAQSLWWVALGPIICGVVFLYICAELWWEGRKCR